MKQIVKDLWVKSLIGEGYRIGRTGFLKNGPIGNHVYDPFGILCEIFVKKGKAEWVTSSSILGDIWWIDGDNAFGLSDNIVSLAGFDVDFETDSDESLVDALVGLWDSTGDINKFVEYIEEHWEAL